MQEVFTYPWMDAVMLGAVGQGTDDLFELAAPPSPDTRYLRASLLPNLIQAAVINQHHFDDFGLFEAGAVFPAKREEKQVAGLLFGTQVDTLFQRLKGVLDMVARKAHLTPWTYRPDQSLQAWQDPAIACVLEVDGVVVGSLARVNNRNRRAAGIKRGELVGFELNLALLEAHITRNNIYRPLPAYPETGFDITVLLGDAVHWSAIESAVGPLDDRLRSCTWIGEYRGKGVESGQRALTFRVALGLPDRTLTAEEAEAVRSRILALIADRFDARPR